MWGLHPAHQRQQLYITVRPHDCHMLSSVRTCKTFCSPKYPVSGTRKTITGGSCHKKYNFCCDKHIFVTTKHFLLPQKHAYRDKMFVTTNIFLSRQIFVATNNFVATKVLSGQAYFCCNKHVFVVTKDMLSCDKSMLVMTKLFPKLLSWQTRTNTCHDKSFAATKVFCHDKHSFVVTKVLLWQAYFCHDKTFVMTKMILVAAPASDKKQGWQTGSSLAPRQCGVQREALPVLHKSLSGL